MKTPSARQRFFPIMLPIMICSIGTKTTKRKPNMLQILFASFIQRHEIFLNWALVRVFMQIYWQKWGFQYMELSAVRKCIHDPSTWLISKIPNMADRLSLMETFVKFA